MIKPKYMNARSLCIIAMMSAMSILLGFWPEIPMTVFAPWLKLDFAYIPMLLTGYALGFLPGLCVLTLKNVFQLLTTNSAGIGQLADMICGIMLLFPALLIYRIRHNRSGVLLGMLCGSALMIISAIFSNLYLLLPFYGMSSYIDTHPGLVWVSIIPFNAIKSVSVCLVTFLIYKPLSPFLKKTGTGTKNRKKETT